MEEVKECESRFLILIFTYFVLDAQYNDESGVRPNTQK